MRTLFLDTNIFLQCKDLETLPWGEISNGQDLLLLIPRTVQRELDRLKQDGNSRRASRARGAASFLRGIVLSERSIKRLRPTDPKVEISFPSTGRESDLEHHALDLSLADDRIVAEALRYRKDNPDQSIELLSNDSGLILTAKNLNLPFVVIPDGWLIPPEPDARDKRIAALELRLKEIERLSPKIEIQAHLGDHVTITHLDLMVDRFSFLSEAEIEQVTTELKARFPLVNHFPVQANTRIDSLLAQYQPPSQAQIMKYQETDYPQWLDTVKEYLKRLPSRLESREVSMFFSIDNQGAAPAENTVVEFSCSGGFLVGLPTEPTDPPHFISLPSPPQPPTGRWVDYIGEGLSGRRFADLLPPKIQDLAAFQLPFLAGKATDRHGFYWKPRRPVSPEQVCALECQEFRHQVEPESFHLGIFVPSVLTAENGSIECRVTARNLPKPVVFNVPLRIQYVVHSTMERVEQALRQQREERAGQGDETP